MWADLAGGVPDGICIDAEAPSGRRTSVTNICCVRADEGGQVLQTIELDRGCFAGTLGGADGTTLFVMAAQWRGPANTLDEPRTGQVLAAQAPEPGAGWP